MGIERKINNMEQFNIEKHWNKFLDDGLYIHCKTKELAEEFLSYCDKQQIVWSTGECLLNYSCWANEYKDGISYRRDIEDGNLVYTSIYHSNSVEFKGFTPQLVDTLSPFATYIQPPTTTTREIIEVI